MLGGIVHKKGAINFAYLAHHVTRLAVLATEAENLFATDPGEAGLSATDSSRWRRYQSATHCFDGQDSRRQHGQEGSRSNNLKAGRQCRRCDTFLQASSCLAPVVPFLGLAVPPALSASSIALAGDSVISVGSSLGS